LFSEGLLAFDGEGRICAVNQSTLNLLGQARVGLLGQSVEAFFECSLDQLLGRASANATASWPLRTRDGRHLFAALRGQPVRVSAPPARPVTQTPRLPGICLGDPALQEGFRKALRVFERDVPLLINGETGSGKEAFAKAVHLASQRADRAFVALNCAAIPESLIESELFGYRGGSFTGALKDGMRGKLQQADGGTLFLDEIGDMPLALQTRLLRVLAGGEFYRVGGRELIKSDVRVLAATHQDLDAKVARGEFRADLMHRLDVVRIHLPALRERRPDIPLLAKRFLAAAAAEIGLPEKRFTQEALQALGRMDFPGNVRQLENLCRRLAVIAPGASIRREDLFELGARTPSARGGPALPWESALRTWADAELTAGAGNLHAQARERFDRVLLDAALAAHEGHRQNAAKALGLGRNTLTRKLGSSRKRRRS
jgi:DNA-binding NtrC family response regulator